MKKKNKYVPPVPSLVFDQPNINLLSHPRDNIRDKALTLLADDISKVSFAIGSLEKMYVRRGRKKNEETHKNEIEETY
jgi:hypothetical protein